MYRRPPFMSWKGCCGVTCSGRGERARHKTSSRKPELPTEVLDQGRAVLLHERPPQRRHPPLNLREELSGRWSIPHECHQFVTPEDCSSGELADGDCSSMGNVFRKRRDQRYCALIQALPVAEESAPRHGSLMTRSATSCNRIRSATRGVPEVQEVKHLRVRSRPLSPSPSGAVIESAAPCGLTSVPAVQP